MSYWDAAQGLETLEQLNGKAKEDLSQSEQESLQEYPLSLRILAQSSGTLFCAAIG